MTGPGLINQAADDVARTANELHHEVRYTFNGTPLVGYPGNTGREVEMRWHYERMLYQIVHGLVPVSEIRPKLETLGPEWRAS